MNGYYKRSRAVASRVVDGEAVLVKMPEGVLYILNPSASRVWLAADGVRPVDELARGPDRASAEAFLDRCVELGLMERTPSPAEERDVFPQEAELPISPEAPEIRLSEPVETLAGPSCSLVDMACGTPST